MSFIFWLLGLFGFSSLSVLQSSQSQVQLGGISSGYVLQTGETYACFVGGTGGKYTEPTSDHTWTNVTDMQYDVLSDDSLWKYVSPTIGLSNQEYVPPDLVVIDSLDFIEVRNNEGKLRKEAASALAELAKAFHQEFGKSLVIVSSYRGYAFQKQLLQGYTAKMGTGKAQGLSALPGHSEHQLGLAIDIFNTSADGGEGGYKSYFAWMRSHAHMFGWTQSYQKGVAIDGYITEPWHRRYVGVELATYLWKKKITFSEYVNSIMK